MNHNLLGPWANPPRCSPPQTPLFAFFNRQNADFLFHDGGDKVEIWCQAGVRSPALSWSLHHNQLVKPFRTGEAEALPGNLFRIEIPTAGLKPGFYDVRVKIEGLGFDRLELFFDRKTGKAQKTPPTAWFDSAPLGVVRADATNILLRSAPHTSGDWIVALEREFQLLSDRLVLSERLLPLSTNDNGPPCSQIANANGNSFPCPASTGLTIPA